MSVRTQVVFGVIWLLLGVWRLVGMLTATRDLLVWDWPLAVAFFGVSLMWFVSAYLKAQKDKRPVP